jgi:hypothetical protein
VGLHRENGGTEKNGQRERRDKDGKVKRIKEGRRKDGGSENLNQKKRQEERKRIMMWI